MQKPARIIAAAVMAATYIVETGKPVASPVK